MYLIIEEKTIDGRVQLAAKLEEDYEYNLFNNLFYDKRLTNFFHYTSFESLFHIINGGKLHLNSLIGLNDKSELNLVNNFMGSGFENPYHPVTMMYHNRHFIFCLSENKDLEIQIKLTTWFRFKVTRVFRTKGLFGAFGGGKTKITGKRQALF